MKKVIIFGTGLVAEVISVYLQEDSDYTVVGFTANQQYLGQEEILGLPVFPYETLTESHPPSEFSMFIAIGYAGVNQTRARVFDDAKRKGYQLISYVSSKVSYVGQLDIGENCFIFEDNTIQPFVKIGDNVIMWSGNHIGHHSCIGNHCFISSHVVISGNVNVGEYCFLGVNSTFRDNIKIGKSNVIGAGALIMKSTEENEVYITGRTKPDGRKSDELGM